MEEESTNPPEAEDDLCLRLESHAELPPRLFSQYRELGKEATWTLSSAKSGNGAEALRNGEIQTYWQSDGPHPHTITIHFHRRAALTELAIFASQAMDDSYAPNHIRVLAGNLGEDDFELVVEVKMEPPMGWVLIPLFHPTTKQALKTFVLQIEIVSMIQNGKDTHVRGVRLFGPKVTSPSFESTTTSLLQIPLLH